MVSAHTYPTFELSDAVLMLAKTSARERKLGPCLEIPYSPKILSPTLQIIDIRKYRHTCVYFSSMIDHQWQGLSLEHFGPLEVHSATEF